MNAQTCSEACPLCDADALEFMTRNRDFDKDGVQFHVDDLEYAVCRECGAWTTTAAQSRHNKRRIIAAQKAASGMLTGDEIKAIRTGRLGGVTQQTMAAVLGVGINTFSRYETDAVVQSDAMNSLLVVLDEYPQAFETLAKRRGVMVERPEAEASYTILRGFMNEVPRHYDASKVMMFDAYWMNFGLGESLISPVGYARKVDEVVL